MNLDEPSGNGQRFAPPKISADGTITCGQKCFTAHATTIRAEILKIIGRSNGGHLLRHEYAAQLIRAHLRPKDLPTMPAGLLTEPYRRRQNNVDKAISRLRRDLWRMFKDEFPDGTSWMRYSKKINGWLLYQLPALGCDGNYHP
jgi:hypothetical protein